MMNDETVALLCLVAIAAALIFALCRLGEARRNMRIQFNERLLHRRDAVELGDTDILGTHYDQPTRKHWFNRKSR